MGSSEGDPEERFIHQVGVREFLMSKYEVTQGQWKKIMGNNPSFFSGENSPIEQV